MQNLSLNTKAAVTLAALFCASALFAQNAVVAFANVPTFETSSVESMTSDATAMSSSNSADALPDAPLPSEAEHSSMSSVRSHHAAASLQQNNSFPDAHQRLHNYLAGAVGPGAFIAAGISAGVDQSHSLKVGYPGDGYLATGNHPAHGVVPEWSEGFEGYSKRYASRFGMSLVSTTTKYGLGEILHEDVSYHRCECTGTLRRSEHALEQSFVAHTASGKAVPSIPALVAPFVGAEVAVAGWYPARYNVSDALRTSTNLYIGVPVQNLVNEFLRR